MNPEEIRKERHMMLKDDDCLKNTEIMKFQDFNKVYGKIAPELNEFWNEEHPIWGQSDIELLIPTQTKLNN